MYALPLGCGSGTSRSMTCTPVGFLITAGPRVPSAPPDHTAMPPGNQEFFIAAEGALYGPGCATPQSLAVVPAQWSTSDSQNVTISSANDATNGLATCLGATNATVTATLTADGFTQTRSA